MEHDDYFSSMIQEIVILRLRDQIANLRASTSQQQNDHEQEGTRRNVMTTDTTTILGFLTLGKSFFYIS